MSKVKNIKNRLTVFTAGLIVDNGFDSVADLKTSFVHDRLLLITIPWAILSGAIETYMGLEVVTVFAFVCLLTLELMSGLMASKVAGREINSRRMGRFGFKLFAYLMIFFIVWTVRNQYTEKPIIYGLFDWLHSTMFIYVCIEYLLSVLENVGEISGKPKNYITGKVADKLREFLNKNTEV